MITGMIKIHKAWLKTKTELKKSFAVEFCITNHTHLIHVLLILSSMLT